MLDTCDSGLNTPETLDEEQLCDKADILSIDPQASDAVGSVKPRGELIKELLERECELLEEAQEEQQEDCSRRGSHRRRTGGRLQ